MFSKIVAENFMCFQNFEVDLKNKGLTQIVGESEDRSFTSNGVGKTSITEAIIFCLFGSTTKGVSGDNVVNKQIGKDCFVSVEFDDGLSVKRYRKHSKLGNALILCKNGKEFQKKTVRETEKVLLERLNLSQDIFQILSYVSQENASFFIDSTDVNQKTMFDKILNLTKFKDAHEKVVLDIDNINILLNESEHAIKEFNIKLNALIENLEVLERNKKEYEEIQDKKRWQLKGEKDKIKEGLKPLYSELEKLEFNLSNLEYDENIDDIIESKKIEIGKVRVQFLAVEKEKIKLEGECRLHTKKIETIEKGECPTCGSKFEGSNKDDLINSLEELLLPLNESLNENDIKQSEFKERLSTLNDDVKDLERQSKESFREQEKLKNNVKLKNREIENLISKLAEVEERIDEKDMTIDNLAKDVDNVKVDIIKLADNIEEEEKIEKGCIAEKKLLSFWEKSFSKKGIRSFILDNVIDSFNEQINYYLSEIGYNNIQVMFSNKSILKSGEERERISFTITIDSLEYDYQSLSGGEKTRLNLAVLFALRDLVTTNKSNILVLDETFSFLDLAGCEAVVSLLKNKLSEKSGLDSIFIVNHNALLDTFVSDKLVVRREGQFSKIMDVT